ncbi:MAG TPA: hypothetical protein VM597_24195 [Gemmataceae bacterium]|jgi:hypothetical protein|nr:hypothetical protein [Gemmataceae bacterium]
MTYDDPERADYTDEPDFSRPATRREVAELRTLVRGLERRVERETAVVAAVSDVLLEALGHDRTEFLNRVRDALARQADPLEKKCRKCGRPVPVRAHRCIYCEADRSVESLTDLLWVN